MHAIQSNYLTNRRGLLVRCCGQVCVNGEPVLTRSPLNPSGGGPSDYFDQGGEERGPDDGELQGAPQGVHGLEAVRGPEGLRGDAYGGPVAGPAGEAPPDEALASSSSKSARVSPAPVVIII